MKREKRKLKIAKGNRQRLGILGPQTTHFVPKMWLEFAQSFEIS